MKRNYKVIDLIFLGLAVLILGVSVSSFVFDDKPTPHRNAADLKISQYSDKAVNQSAVATNLKFKDLVFETEAKPQVFHNQIATVVRAVKSVVKKPLPKGEEKEYGTWIWTPIIQMTPEYMQEIISGAKNNNLNTIYLSLDSYLDIFVMEKSALRDGQRKAFSEQLNSFISLANQNGLEVDAEAGWRNWAEDDNAYKALAIVNYVKNFNATHKNKFRGFQYDVEPYLLEKYKKDPAAVLKNFVKLVDQTERALDMEDFRFSVVIPDFYDEKDKFTPRFVYEDARESVFKHLLNILDRRPDSSIIVMSYRNFAEGEDGAIEVSANEMQTARRGLYNTKIIIAQETGDVPPPYITFHGTSKKYLLGQIEKINATFDSYENFGGIAIHYANAFLALR